MSICLKRLLLLGALLSPSLFFGLTIPGSVSDSWLKAHIGNPALKIIEMSDGSTYAFDGHIPYAQFTNKSDWRYQVQDGSLVHLPIQTLEKKIQDIGINGSDAVLIYYKGNNLNEILGAHYLFWLFHYLGHTNVGILDQGWHGWLAAKGTVSDKENKITVGDFTARPIKALEISTSELYAIHGAYNVVDARPHDYFLALGKFPSNTRYGRIAGSINQPWADYLITDKEGLLYIDNSKKVPLLKAQILTKEQPILLTCFGGTGSAMDYYMFYINGYKNLRVHDEGLRRWNSQHYPLDIPESLYNMLKK